MDVSCCVKVPPPSMATTWFYGTFRPRQAFGASTQASYTTGNSSCAPHQDLTLMTPTLRAIANDRD
jgi:hypothetical protein